MLALDRILIARDFSSVSERALRYAFDLAARTGADLHVLHAEVLHEGGEDPDRPAPTDGLDAIRRELADQERSPGADALDAVSVHGAVERDVAAGPAILNYADEHGIDLITMGTHGRRGARRVLIGSVAEEVVRQSDRPVLTVRGKQDASFAATGAVNRILVPVDFSDHSREALLYARELAALYDAQVDLLHVIEERLPPAYYVGGVKSIYDTNPDIEDEAVDALTSFAEETAGPEGTVVPHAVPGSASSAVVEFVEEHDIDLVATSTHGRTGLDRFLLGSVAEKIVRHVHCPVLTVKAFGKSLVSNGAEA